MKLERLRCGLTSCGWTWMPIGAAFWSWIKVEYYVKGVKLPWNPPYARLLQENLWGEDKALWCYQPFGIMSFYEPKAKQNQLISILSHSKMHDLQETSLKGQLEEEARMNAKTSPGKTIIESRMDSSKSFRRIMVESKIRVCRFLATTQWELKEIGQRLHEGTHTLSVSGLHENSCAHSMHSIFHNGPLARLWPKRMRAT